MRPCKLCPCNPKTPEHHRQLLRSQYESIVESGGFPCHAKHPKAHALHPDSIGVNEKYHTIDCLGYKLWGLTLQEKNYV